MSYPAWMLAIREVGFDCGKTIGRKAVDFRQIQLVEIFIIYFVTIPSSHFETTGRLPTYQLVSAPGEAWAEPSF